MNEKTKKLVTAGVLTGITLLMGLTPIGYPPLTPTRMTTMHIPVAIATMTLGFWYGLYFGLLFGLTSLLSAYTVPTIVSPLFYNPFIAVLPRIFVPVAVYFAFTFFDRVFAGKKRYISGAIGGIVAALTNTVLVLGAIYMVFGVKAYAMFAVENFSQFIGALLLIASTNGLIEAAGGGIICGPIMAALSRRRKEG